MQPPSPKSSLRIKCIKRPRSHKRHEIFRLTQVVNTAATTGANAALNNYLMHTEATRRAELRQQCSSPSGCSAELKAELERLDALDKQRDTDLRNACSPQAGGSPGSAACQSQYALLQAARATYGHYYLSPELKSSSNFAHMSAQDWLQVHEDVSKVVQFLNWYDPQREPPAGSTAPTRDRLTNLPLDEQGRYTRTVVIGGQMYQPKYHACATAECIANNATWTEATRTRRRMCKHCISRCSRIFKRLRRWRRW